MKLKTISTLFLLYFGVQTIVFSQQVYSYVEEMPEADYKIGAFLSKNLTYPEIAAKEGIEGKVTVRFIVDSLGNITQPEIVHAIHPSLDSESIRVISLLPPWKPGKKNGVPVNVYYTLPVQFKLAEQHIIYIYKENGLHETVVAEKAVKPHFDIDSFIKNNIRYPEDLKENNVVGTVVIEAVVLKNGELDKITIGGSVHDSLDAEALRIVRMMPKVWEPAIYKGAPVNAMTFFNIPFPYSLWKKIHTPMDSIIRDSIIKAIEIRQKNSKTVMPKPDYDVNDYLSKNLKYPSKARDYGFEGRVLVRFVVDEEGNITYVHTPKPVNYYLDVEARRVIETMPKWNPATLDGKPVKVYFSQYIKFVQFWHPK